MRAALDAAVERRASRLAVRAGQLEAISPLKVLARGYSVTTDGDGRALRSVDGVQPGDRLETRLANGRLRTQVLDVEPGERPTADEGSAGDA